MKINRFNRVLRRTRQKAFSLVEVMMGVMVLGAGITALYTGITYGFTVMKMTRENLRATQVMLETFEIIRLYSWDQLNTAGFVPANIFANTTNVWNQSSPDLVPIYTGTVTLTDVAAAPSGNFNVSYSNNLKMVTVTLNWEASGRLQTRSMSTLVARGGLQNYVY